MAESRIKGDGPHGFTAANIYDRASIAESLMLWVNDEWRLKEAAENIAFAFVSWDPMQYYIFRDESVLMSRKGGFSVLTGPYGRVIQYEEGEGGRYVERTK